MSTVTLTPLLLKISEHLTSTSSVINTLFNWNNDILVDVCMQLPSWEMSKSEQWKRIWGPSPCTKWHLLSTHRHALPMAKAHFTFLLTCHAQNHSWWKNCARQCSVLNKTPQNRILSRILISPLQHDLEGPRHHDEKNQQTIIPCAQHMVKIYTIRVLLTEISAISRALSFAKLVSQVTWMPLFSRISLHFGSTSSVIKTLFSLIDIFCNFSVIISPKQIFERLMQLRVVKLGQPREWKITKLGQDHKPTNQNTKN